MLEIKTTSNGRQPQNIKSWIYQQPLIGSSSNFKLKLRGPNQHQKSLKWRSSGDQTKIKHSSNGRRPPMEDNLRILKVEYISNHWSDLPEISNFMSGDQTKIYNTWNEDNLNILLVKYLSNHYSDLPQI